MWRKFKDWFKAKFEEILVKKILEMSPEKLLNLLVIFFENLAKKTDNKLDDNLVQIFKGICDKIIAVLKKKKG